METWLLTLLLTIALLAIALVALGVKVLFVKNGKFPSGHVSHNKALRDRNITCAHQEK
ncbi:MAG: hypothetical protein K1V81_07220 [Paramuribaculum sp.]|jgi:hypothetical protein